MTIMYVCWTEGDMDAESSAKGLFVNIKYPGFSVYYWRGSALSQPAAHIILPTFRQQPSHPRTS
jgi:hypothetical protein